MFKNLHVILHIDEPASASLATAGKVAVPLLKILMKDVTSLLLVAYVLLILNPVMPIIADGVAHTFWEKQHLMTVHNVNGKYHVHFELLKNDRRADSKTPGSLKNAGEDYVHTIFNVAYNFTNKNYIVKQTYPDHVWLFYPQLFINIDYPPPRA